MAVGDVMTKDEEACGNVIVGRTDGITLVLGAEHLETVNDTLRESLATIGKIACLDGERLLIQWRFQPQLIATQRVWHLAERHMI